MATAKFADPLARNRAIMRGALHFGTVSGLLGARSLVLYGATTAPTAREPAK
jgi:succinoglycan biosynthesis protein ExoM